MTYLNDKGEDGWLLHDRMAFVTCFGSKMEHLESWVSPDVDHVHRIHNSHVISAASLALVRLDNHMYYFGFTGLSGVYYWKSGMDWCHRVP